MAGLEKLVHILPGSQHALRRYLTLFYGFTLGLGLILAFFAIQPRGNADLGIPARTQLAALATASPTSESTQAPIGNTPTSLPAIPATPNENTPSPLGVTSGELRGLTVSLWHPWAGTEGAALQAILDEFNRTNRWGITVQATAYAGFGALEEAVAGTLTTGALPDVLVDYGYQARHLENNGAIIDITPYVDDPLWGLTKDEQADFYPGFWQEDLLSQGQAPRLAVPYYRSAYGLFYNRGLARELGFSNAPKTPDEFRIQACAAVITAEGGQQSVPHEGGLLVTTQPAELLGWIYAFGGDITPGMDGYSFNTPEVRQALVYLKELQEAGCSWMDPEADPQSVFANRGALFVVGSLLDISTQQKAFAQAGNTDEWTILPFPSKIKPVVDVYGPSLMVARSTPPRQVAGWLVIEWLVYPPNQAEWVEALGVYPTRRNSLTYLGGISAASPQWEQSLDLLPLAHSEPTLASWGAMRWSLQDAMLELFNQKYTGALVPSILENLDHLAADVVGQVH